MKQKEYKDKLKTWTTQRLEAECKAFYEAIHGDSACYGVSDLIILNLMEEELSRRDNIPCDNTDCEGDCEDIKPVKMLKEFEGGTFNWCEDCRTRDEDMIDDS